MLIDTKQIITKTQLRENLSEILMLVNQGKKMMVSDRGKLVAKMTPIKEEKSVKEKEVDTFMAEMKALREKLSRQNPNFDSVKAIREIRREN